MLLVVVADLLSSPASWQQTSSLLSKGSVAGVRTQVLKSGDCWPPLSRLWRCWGLVNWHEMLLHFFSTLTRSPWKPSWLVMMKLSLFTARSRAPVVGPPATVARDELSFCALMCSWVCVCLYCWLACVWEWVVCPVVWHGNQFPLNQLPTVKFTAKSEKKFLFFLFQLILKSFFPNYFAETYPLSVNFILFKVLRKCFFCVFFLITTSTQSCFVDRSQVNRQTRRLLWNCD